MSFSGKLIAAFFAVAAVGVTGSPVEFVKRDSIGSVQYCRLSDCGTNWSVNSGQCYQTGGIYWLDTFDITPAPGTTGAYYGMVCTMFSDFGCQTAVDTVADYYSQYYNLGSEQVRSYNCIDTFEAGNSGDK